MTQTQAPRAKKRNPLLPWFIGLGVIAALDAWIAYRMFDESCPAPGVVEAMVVVLIPAIYLALMYLTFKSQD